VAKKNMIEATKAERLMINEISSILNVMGDCLAVWLFVFVIVAFWVSAAIDLWKIWRGTWPE